MQDLPEIDLQIRTAGKEGSQMAEKNRKRKKAPEGRIHKFTLILFSVLFSLSLIVYLNEKVFKLEFIPTTAKIISLLSGEHHSTVSVADGEIAVHFIDVGQGDCELIVAGDTRVLIDSGERVYSGDVIRYISRLGFRRLDYIIATHPHEDHIGGMADIINEFSVGKIIMPEIPDSIMPTGGNFEDMLNVISQKEIDAEYSSVGMKLELGAGAVLEFLSPVHDDYSSLNNYSIACRLVHGKRSFLFTGDIERAAESDIVNSGEYIRSDVLKVAHHGSTSSSTPAFLEAVMPEYAVICVGKDNSYGHPKPEVLNRLWDIGCHNLLTTMAHGNIVFVSDGSTLKLHTDNYSPDSNEAEEAA